MVLAPLQLTQVADDVHVATGTNVNWALVTDGPAVTLVDAGYPRDAGLVLASVEAIGRRVEDVVAIALTHAHLDHLGGVPAVVARSGARVLTGAEEARHARREYVDQISPAALLAQVRRRGGLRWVGQTLRAVGPHLRLRVADVEALDPDHPLDVPGTLVAVPTPGHTPGHTAYLMPSTGVLFSGDALVTGHPLSPREGPQRLPDVFAPDVAAVRAAIAGLRDVPAEVLVPGHGLTLEAPLADVVDAALTRHDQ